MPKSYVFALSAVVLASCSTTNPNPPELGFESPNSAIEKLGYDAVSLPSTAYGPGSFVTSVKGFGMTSPLKLTYLCRPDFTNTPPPIIDGAASAQASRIFSGSFKLGVSALADLGISAEITDIESVTIKFSDVKIEQLGFDDLQAIRSGLGPKCQEIVQKFSKDGIAYQTKQAIRADVTYNANFKRGASAEAKNIAIQALKATFGGSVESSSDSSLTGTGLYYGLLLAKV